MCASRSMRTSTAWAERANTAYIYNICIWSATTSSDHAIRLVWLALRILNAVPCDGCGSLAFCVMSLINWRHLPTLRVVCKTVCLCVAPKRGTNESRTDWARHQFVLLIILLRLIHLLRGSVAQWLGIRIRSRHKEHYRVLLLGVCLRGRPFSKQSF